MSAHDALMAIYQLSWTHSAPSGVLVYAWRNRLPKLSDPVGVRLILRHAPTFLISFIAVMYMLLGYYTPSYACLDNPIAIGRLFILAKRTQIALSTYGSFGPIERNVGIEAPRSAAASMAR
jgi:hypothetical protein